MAEFREITLHRIEPPVTIKPFDNIVEFSGVEKSVKEWERWVERVNRTLRRYKLIAPDKTKRSQPVSGGTRFIYHNLPQINQMRRGKIKRAPWYLRWKADYIINKEELIDNDRV